MIGEWPVEEGAARHQQRAHRLTSKQAAELVRAFAELRARPHGARSVLLVSPRALRHIGRGNAARFARRLGAH